MLRAVALLSLSLLSGCCAFDSNVPTTDEFVRHMNADIGAVKSFQTFPDWAGLRSEPHEDGTLWYTTADPSGCSVAWVVDARSRVVKSWRYLSEPEHCKATRRYCGPW